MKGNKFLIAFRHISDNDTTAHVNREEKIRAWCESNIDPIEGFPRWQFSLHDIGPDGIRLFDGIYIFDKDHRMAFCLAFDCVNYIT